MNLNIYTSVGGELTREIFFVASHCKWWYYIEMLWKPKFKKILNYKNLWICISREYTSPGRFGVDRGQLLGVGFPLLSCGP